MKVLFLGCFYPIERRDEFKDKSIGYFDSAADNFQWALLDGFKHYYTNEELITFTIPAIGIFPFKFKKIFSSSSNIVIDKGYSGKCISFFTFPIINRISKYIYLKKELLKDLSNDEDIHIIVYSLSSTTLLLVKQLKKTYKSIRVTVVIPDLPQYMSSNKNPIYLMLKKCDRMLIDNALQHVDAFVLINANMYFDLKICNRPWIVIEGIYNIGKVIEKSIIDKKDNEKIIFYSGGICKMYGLEVLLQAFCLLADENIRLWLCGEGDYVFQVQKYAKTDSRIKYFGVLSHSMVLDLQRNSDVLVNPRLSEGVYTRDSFPSKTIEYLVSGKPVVMFSLEGIPKDYIPFLNIVYEETGEALANMVRQVLALSKEEVVNRGKLAQSYILSEKSSVFQTGKIVAMLKKII